jgi:hypothetical protein
VGAGHGLNWLRHLDCGEFLVYLPIALMACVAFVSCAVLLPYYIRRRARALLTVAVLQLLVLLWAALSRTWP